MVEKGMPNRKQSSGEQGLPSRFGRIENLKSSKPQMKTVVTLTGPDEHVVIADRSIVGHGDSRHNSLFDRRGNGVFVEDRARTGGIEVGRGRRTVVVSEEDGKVDLGTIRYNGKRYKGVATFIPTLTPRESRKAAQE